MTKWDLRGMKAPHQTDEQLSDKLRAAEHEVLRMDWATVATLYRHRRTGNRYVATSIALDSYSLTPQVIYSKANKPWITFSRPVAEFLEKFEREV